MDEHAQNLEENERDNRCNVHHSDEWNITPQRCEDRLGDLVQEDRDGMIGVDGYPGEERPRNDRQSQEREKQIEKVDEK